MEGLPRDDRRRTDLDDVATARTLRDVLHELPVDAVVPGGWRVGVEVVQFGDALPADAVTLRHEEYGRDLLVTPAGAAGEQALVVYERDRTAGDRVAVAAVPNADSDRAVLRDALAAAARHADRIAGGDPDERAVDGDGAVTVQAGDRDGDDSRLTFY
ncbi:hypothetical protein [Halobaculum sp. D14]|uniref:hypothetical protein n=1 Tax=unclassified Halobaculum TaxID=2640896 RepID=UPI003EC019AA